jgi:quinol monooxygenase YgiN
MWAVIWEFRPHDGREAEFVAAYGPRGDWAALFARDEHWLGTDLLRDVDDASRYVTIDRWTSRAAYDSFRSRAAAEYAALDRACDALTAHEARLGTLERPDANADPSS